MITLMVSHFSLLHHIFREPQWQLITLALPSGITSDPLTQFAVVFAALIHDA